MMRALLPVAAASLAACVHYAPAPVDPAREASAFAARRLDDPGLQAWLATAPDARQPPVWDLPTLSRVALYYSADLDVARAELHASQAAIVTAGARPNPSIFIPAWYSFNPGPGSPWIVNPSFDIPIETAGKRERRIEQATHVSEAARIDLAATAWRVRSRVRSALLEHLVALQALDLARADAALRADSVLLLRARLAAGAVPGTEVSRAQREATSAALAARQADGAVASTRAALAGALGVAPEALDGIDLAWTPLDAPPPVAALPRRDVQREALIERLELRGALADYAAAESALALEIAKQYPDLHLGPGYQYDQGQQEFQIGIGVELPIFDRHQGPIAEAFARREAAGAKLLAVQASIVADLEAALASYRATRAALDDADALLELSRQRERQAERAFDLGEADRLDLVSARVERNDAERTRLDALEKTEAALGALEDTGQRPLDAGLAAPEATETSPRAEAARPLP